MDMNNSSGHGRNGKKRSGLGREDGTTMIVEEEKGDFGWFK